MTAANASLYTGIGACAGAYQRLRQGAVFLETGRTRGPALTGRELQVLRRLVEGQSNKAIAVQLGITSKTVEFHVSKLLKKHDVRSRYELMDAFARPDLGTVNDDKPGGSLRFVGAPLGHPNGVIGELIRDPGGRVLLVRDGSAHEPPM